MLREPGSYLDRIQTALKPIIARKKPTGQMSVEDVYPFPLVLYEDLFKKVFIFAVAFLLQFIGRDEAQGS
jgi:hypothetical protein